MLRSHLNIKQFYNFHKRHLLKNLQCRNRFLSDGSSNKSKRDLYSSLGLNSSASASEIKQAYYDLSFKYHPDKNKDNLEAANKFREVTEAYEVLGNYGLRKRYDKGLPLPLTRRENVPIRPVEEMEVPLQKFFDSRSRSQSSAQKDKFEEDAFEFHNEYETRGSLRKKRYDAALKESKNIRGLLAVFLVVVMVVFKYSFQK